MAPDKRVIGVDEAGKGDFFGPLVVAGLLCRESQEKRLLEYGVRDSKLISDNKILSIDDNLRAVFPHFVLVVLPEEYNNRYKEIKNLNKLLAVSHSDVIQKLVQEHGADKIILDKFGKTELVEKVLAERKIKIELVQVEHGERLPQVAAASVLARAAFVRAIDEMSAQVGVEIPKGASSLVDEAARRLVKKHGDKVLLKLTKVHFKNYNKVLSPSLFG
jgi:ribonuclease HIII